MNNNYSFYLLILCCIVYIIYKNRKYNPSSLILRIKYKLSMVEPKFFNYDIRESSDSSYTENKSTIYLCTKDPKTGITYDDNILIYVALHECAHVLCENYGHDEEFKKKLSMLIIGIYNSNIPVPSDYCGLK